MLQAFIITLREGVEAALIVGITLAYLAKIGRNDLRKSVYAGLAAAFVGSIGVAVVLFILNGKVVWGYCALMAVLAALGGYLGARYSKKINQKVMRRLVASIGFITAAYFFWHAYGPKS